MNITYYEEKIAARVLQAKDFALSSSTCFVHSFIAGKVEDSKVHLLACFFFCLGAGRLCRRRCRSRSRRGGGKAAGPFCSCQGRGHARHFYL